MSSTQLPVDSSLPALKEASTAHKNAVLIAAPGAGKTTRVPLALLGEVWLGNGKIIMLEPRRLAARGAAKYMADQLGEKPGDTVGYRVRMDTRVGKRTRIEVVTEGVLTRMLQNDPALEGIGLVIFDEFHERSLNADLALALCLQSQELLREDLHLLIMSATLDAEPVANLLGGAPVIISEGSSFPVETIYRSKSPGVYLEDNITLAIENALRIHDGDILVFLPGISEIRSVESKLKRRLGNHNNQVKICLLHGSLPADMQDQALSPMADGRRKVVLATAVAETSLTVEGITVVIDSGLMRVSRFSPRTGMSRLETIPVSVASADQRRGRAGRLMPGTCYRLWSREEQQSLSARSLPEILEADLSGMLLELVAWGANDPLELAWLDQPPEPALLQAKELLIQLGALNESGTKITSYGKQMAKMGRHPRLAHMLLRARHLGLSELGCRLAVLLGEKDIFVTPKDRTGSLSADIRLRIEALRGASVYAVDDNLCRRLIDEAKRLGEELAQVEFLERAGEGGPDEIDENAACGLLLAFAYPDRIGRRRENGKYLMSGGRGARFAEGQPLAYDEWIVAAELDDSGTDSRIRLAAPIRYVELIAHLRNELRAEADIYWDAESQSVRARMRKHLGAIVLEETPLSRPPADRVIEALLEGIKREGLDMLPWTRAARQLQERVEFVRAYQPSWPNLSNQALLDSLQEWLAPHVEGLKSRADLQKLNVRELLESMLSWEQRRELEIMAPTHWSVPSGSKIAIDYSDPQAPVLAVRLQELFGLPATPRIVGGRVPLTLHLLSPAQRPVQVTRDLASFWSEAYFEVRKDLKGRYPKHYWPDNPLEAQATRRAKPSK